MTASTYPRYPYPYPEPLSARPAGISPDDEWDASDLPDKQGWRDVYGHLFSGMGSATYLKRAERLNGYGFTSDDLRRVCEYPRSVLALDAPDDAETGEQAEALLALTHEAFMYYSAATSVVLGRRDDYSKRLQDFGWSQTQIAHLLGMTRQRVSKFLKKSKTRFGVALPEGKGER